LKTTYQNSLKEAIVANMKLDKDSLITALKDTTCDAYFRVVQMFLYLQYQTDSIPDEIVHTHVLDIVKRTQHSLQYTFKDGYDSFAFFYKNKYSHQPMNDDSEQADATDISVLTEGEEMSLQFARYIGQEPSVVTRTSTTSTVRLTSRTTVIPSHVLIVNNILAMYCTMSSLRLGLVTNTNTN
jgi:hypothetical protein